MKDKIKAAQRVIYSINMTVYTFKYLTREENRYSNPLPINCHLESFLTHVRNLSWFFEKKGKKDDIYVGDFTSQEFVTSLDSGVITEINKSLSHLTYHNIDFKPLWQINSIAVKIFRNCLQFLEDSFFEEITLESEYSESRKELISILRAILTNQQSL